jgi:hypothetical protein
MKNTDDIIAALAQDITPVTLATPPFALFFRWIIATIFYMAFLLSILGVREDIVDKLASSSLFLAEIIALAAVLMSALFSAAAISFPDMHQKHFFVWLPTLMLQIFIAVLFASFLNDNPPAPAPMHGFECLACIVLCSILPAITILYTLRRYATTHYYLCGGIAMLAATSLGCLVLRLSEQTDSIMHLITWHYVPLMVCSMFGVWIGKKCLKW